MKKEKSPDKRRIPSHLGYLLLSAILIILGLLLLVYPTESAETVGYMIASAALLFGILALIHTLSGLRRGTAFAFKVLGEVAVIICGIVLFFMTQKIFAVFVSVIGLFIVTDAAFKLQTVVLSHRYRQKAYWILLVVACLMLLGGYLSVRAELFWDDVGILARLLGVTLFFDGIGNFLSFFYLPTLRRHEQTPTVSGEQEKNSAPEPSEHQS